jgi:hypothetical protein
MHKSLFVSVQNKTSTQGTDLLGERSVHRAALSERKPTQKTKTKIKTEPNRTQIEKKPEMRAHNNTFQKKRNKRKRFTAPLTYLDDSTIGFWLLQVSLTTLSATSSTPPNDDKAQLIATAGDWCYITHKHTNLKAKLLETQSCCCCFWRWEGKGEA